ncbi:MAG: DUF3575 domain-containing protein [Ferruginibacter sp.]|nr:DUF3575 domain-containing protein [Cytophagales bacterium]
MMKKSPWMLGLLILLVGLSPALAQKTTRQPPGRSSREPRKIVTGPQNLLKINPLSIFTLTGSVAYERVINDRMSAQLGFFYTPPTVKLFDTRFNGFGFTPEFRYYPLESVAAPRGFYVAPYLRYQRFRLTYDDPDNDQYDGSGVFSAFGGGVLVGGQWTFGDRISVDAFLGPALNGFNFKADVAQLDNQLEDRIKLPIPGAVSPRFGLTVGVAF